MRYGRIMLLRAETVGDAEAIRHVVASAFGQEAEADLVDALRASGDSEISIVAVDDAEIVGHVLFSRLLSPARCLGLAPVSVAPVRQSEGIGAKLIRAGLMRARQAGWHGVFVLGDPIYYGRFGFAASTAAKFETSYPKAYMLACELGPGAFATLSGPIAYAAPFAALD